jgi:hypothetical protein
MTPTRELLGREVRHLVVGAAQLEAENRLLVFALEQHGVAKPLAERARFLERGFDRHVVNAGVQNFSEIVGRRQRRNRGIAHVVFSKGVFI